MRCSRALALASEAPPGTWRLFPLACLPHQPQGAPSSFWKASCSLTIRTSYKLFPCLEDASAMVDSSRFSLNVTSSEKPSLIFQVKSSPVELCLSRRRSLVQHSLWRLLAALSFALGPFVWGVETASVLFPGAPLRPVLCLVLPQTCAQRENVPEVQTPASRHDIISVEEALGPLVPRQ